MGKLAAQGSVGREKGREVHPDTNRSQACVYVQILAVILIIERELAVKLVTLRRCKYYKWEL